MSVGQVSSSLLPLLYQLRPRASSRLALSARIISVVLRSSSSSSSSPPSPSSAMIAALKALFGNLVQNRSLSLQNNAVTGQSDSEDRTSSSKSLVSPLVVSEAAHPATSPALAKSRPHVDPRTGLFINPWPSAGSGAIKLSEGLYSTLSGEWRKVKTSPDMMPVVFPSFADRQSTGLVATWLGHASYYVQFPTGLRVLFDPVMGNKCAPTWTIGFNRVSPPPCEVSDLPGVDAVFISHAHYDHLDYYTIDKLRHHFPNAHYFVPLGVKSWFDSIGISTVTELDWWEQRDICINGKVNATISALPSQHGANRSVGDHGKTLWASWAVESSGKVYFAGDTGYRHVPRLPSDQDDYAIDMPHCPAFAEIGEHRGPFDLALLPIGAYSPRWIMSKVHANPMDSVNIFKDIRAKRALAMHFGTFVLTDEPLLEPIDKLKEALVKHGIPESGVFDAIQIGSSVEIPVEVPVTNL